MSDYMWVPTADYVDNANVTRLARAHGLGGLDELRARSVADVRWYWDAVVRDLELPFQVPYRDVLDTARGIEHPDWFVGGRTNVVDACLQRWITDPVAADRLAVVHEAEDGTVRTLTYRELGAEVERAAAGLRELGVSRGDAVALFLPMVPEAVVSVYAVARLGAVLVPLFSGFAPSAIASRIQDADAKVVVVADGTVRRGKSVAMKPALAEALKTCPTVESVVVVDNLGAGTVSGEHEISWAGLLASGGVVPIEAMDASEPFALAYTSGTTGKPKGAVHTHAGFLVKTASEVAYSFDLKPGGVFCWITDMGWIMGPLSIVGTHANGGTLLLYEGSPDVPDRDRLWQLTERHRVTMLGVSPTLIRTLRGQGSEIAARYDLSSVHTIGSTGEPWNPDSYEWLAREVFGGRVPIINFSGGTEVGGSFLAPYPVEPIRSCSLGGPSLGMDVDVVDDAGRPLRGEQGELVCRQPWPSMTRGVWKDEERYLEAYWSTFPGMWRHGDYALVDSDGQWYIRGRSDDVMNVAGKRLAPAEVEAVLTAHPAVSEAAAVGVPDPKKGETVWAFWVPRADADGADISGELAASVAAELGKPFAPSVVHRVSRLPKTRSAKILRRAVRAAALGTDPGDLSGAENPEAVEEIRAVVTGTEVGALRA
ncbi:AMP-binding protein [Rhodococcus ruber]|uniref:acetate--CoA ligase n=1 Tax=Rhodococcus indonesiensis TaxID=3055869 RepID=A0ABT7RJY2_9NOCA|nr:MULTISPECIES: AMP-binding protein [Rhodococcus]AXY50558.1 Acetyl-coenzyme A synthetase [Rhodococcus ruber]MBP2210003.1 acetyl-CoA synthetase [Rhodococcus ruber]MDM7487935.1 AMP-binding protein [Rhodococcus indonesiensis]MDO1477919.1 AMP-binding protein [Rhodococcus ruber]UQB73727.1 AMP-binding protein [Rhodococcus ruber]